MLYSYGVTQQGTYHIKNGTVCQDSHYIKKINNHFAVAAVADGLGSEKYTDIASKIAAECSVLYCCENINENDEEEKILSVIKGSFNKALNEVNNIAEKNNHSYNEYDTTLSLAVFIDDNLYFGQSGDSGIVILNCNGLFEPVTEQQRDENGCVFPLAFGEEKWVFGSKKSVASILLATDGVLDALFPYLLRKSEVNIYVALANYLMSAESLRFDSYGEEDVSEKMSKYILNIPDDQISDDKTVVVLLNDSVEIDRQPDAYYAIPNWDELKRKHDEEYWKLAYPQMQKNNDKDNGS